MSPRIEFEVAAVSSITVPVDGSPARICYVINGKPIVESIIRGTNNEGEYKAVIGALYYLAYVLDFRGQVIIKSDSELVLGHLTGAARVRAENLRPLYATVRQLEANFRHVAYEWSPKNMAGDQLEKCRRNDRRTEK